MTNNQLPPLAPPANIIENSSNTTPSTISNTSLEPQCSNHAGRQDTAKSTSSRRRINIQSAASTSAPAESPRTIPSDDEDEHKEEGNIDPFDSLIQELDDQEIEEADGGNSDVEGEEQETFEEAYVRAMLDRKSQDNDADIHVQEINSGDIAYVIAKKGVISEEFDDVDLTEKVIAPPDDWIIPEKKKNCENQEPDFENVDNPGNWNSFIFRPIYKKVGVGDNAKYTYLRHELPTGCSPCPMDRNGIRKYKSWTFHYQGWKSSKFDVMRDGATPDNLFPSVRSSSLDVEVLKKLGMNSDRICDEDALPDALFFFQLLLPMCNPAMSGIDSDPRKAFYTEVTRCSNLYKHQTGIGSTYGHAIPEASMPEFVRFDGCLIRDGVRGGGDGAIYRRWQKKSASSDKVIQKSMTLHRWYQLKRIFKLNNNDKSKEKGEVGYNPCYKYDLIYRTIVDNVIAITREGELDLTGDETTWGFQGYGEKGAKVVQRVSNKPGITKGGQSVLVSATNRVRPYFYQHRHSMTPRYGKGFSAEGPAEVRSCIDELEKHVIGRDSEKKKIFKKCPHITFDNYFSGEDICHYAGKKGFGLLMTNRRDRLPKEVKSEYMHKKKTDSSKRTKVARYIEPVILVNEQDNYEIVLTSFQSTSSCNIISVNSMNSIHNFVEARSRGRKNKKRIYVIEQNLARYLYLKTYSRIDSIDHLIKNCKLHYRTWKYWHAPVNHAKALATVTAYDIYLELCEGKLNSDWLVKDPVDFFTFRDQLSKQMCQYDPKNQRYAGDEKMRVVSQLNVTMRQKRKDIDDITTRTDGDYYISFVQYEEIIRKKHRVCRDLHSYSKHIHSLTRHSSPAKCVVCGIKAYQKCAICGVALHNDDSKGAAKGKHCALEWHDESYLGLCFEDRKLFCVPAKDWKPWNERQLRANKELIKGYRRLMKRSN